MRPVWRLIPDLAGLARAARDGRLDDLLTAELLGAKPPARTHRDHHQGREGEQGLPCHRQHHPLAPVTDQAFAIEATSLAGHLLQTTLERLGDPTLKGLLLGDGHLALHLQQLAGGELRVKGADQLQALEEHLNGTVLHGTVGLVEKLPIQLGIKAHPVGRDLILRQLTRFPKPAIGIGVKTAPIEEGVQIHHLACQLNAVLLKAALQLDVLLWGGSQGSLAGGPEGNGVTRPRPWLKGWELFPLDGAGGLAGDVKGYSIHLGDLIGDPVRDFGN